MKETLPVIVITGATASGKTALAIELAKKIKGEIICADSRIVYRELDIVSAKPSVEERNGVIHHLIDIKSVQDGMYSAGNFVFDAEEIIKNSKCPIIIQGGTWFYIKSLLDCEKLIEFGKNEELRENLKNYSNDELYQILKSKDPKRAEEVHKNNRDKIVRSIELIDAIGGEVSKYKREENKKYNALWFMKNFTRDELYRRIDKRVDKMFDLGLYFEWEKVSSKYPNNDILYNTIGYKELFDLQNGVYKNVNEAKEKIKQHTRNFAKRQLTWFRQNSGKLNINSIECLQDVTKFL